MADNSAPKWAITVKLSEPIELKAKDSGEIIERIEELPFRKPTAQDIIEVGTNPVSVDIFAPNPSSTTKFDAKAMSEMMARLSGRPIFIIGRMGTGDWNYVAWQLSGFFLPAQVMIS